MKKPKHAPQPRKLTVEQKKKAAARKSAVGWTIFLVLLAAAATVLALLPGIAERRGAEEEVSNINSVQPVSGVIETTIHAAGTLTDSDASYVTVPEGVELEYVVKNGDFVSEGDLIATVDETSVVLVIAEIQSALAELDEQIDEARSGEAASELTAPADARVKAVYAQSGESVAQTMYDHGALMLLSLDGKMAVDIPSLLVAAGQSVTVTLSDGTQLSGRVATVTGSVATVTVDDSTAPVGDAVTVTDADDQALGGGLLYIHSELKLTGYYGTTSAVNVSVNESVALGDVLLTLSDTDTSASYAALLSERHELTEQMQKLVRIYQCGGVYADAQGYVAELGQSDSANSDTGDSGGFAPMAYTEFTVVSALDGDDGDDPADDPADDPDEGNDPDPDDDPDEGNDPDDPGNDPDEGDDPADDPDDLDDPDDPGNDPDEGDDPTGEPDNPDDPDDPGEDDLAADYCDVYAVVTAVTDTALQVSIASPDGYVHYGDASALRALDYDASATLALASGDASSSAEPSDADAVLAADLTVLLCKNGEWSVVTPADIAEGDCLVLACCGEELLWIVCHRETKPEADAPSTGDTSGSESSSSSSSSEMSDSSSSGSSSSSSRSSTAVAGAMPTQTQSYALAETQLCAITPDGDMTVTLTIDEMDILSVSEGQTVALALDALGEAFAATVTEIAAEGTNNGGSTKFDVTVTLARTAEMRSGMNAAATISKGETAAAVILPVQALYDLGAETVVYTGWDEKNAQLINPVVVETGVSDGAMVEIVSGLAADTAVYYLYIETLSELVV